MATDVISNQKARDPMSGRPSAGLVPVSRRSGQQGEPIHPQEVAQSRVGQGSEQAEHDRALVLTPASRAADFLELTKPRIVTMIVVTTVATALIGAGGAMALLDMAWLLLGTAMIASSAGAANQVWERSLDQSMLRTANRPLPSGRMPTATAVCFTGATGILGTGILWSGFGITPALAGVVTWFVYVLIYTPMKTRSAWNTTVGAVAGALPVLIGYTATGGQITDATGWLLVGVLATWQYPHFMAIAWLCRDQYASAGFCMTTTVEPTGRSAGIQSIAGSIALIACGTALCWLPQGWLPDGWLPEGMAGAIVGTIAVVLATLPMMLASIRFFADPDDDSARKLLRSSLLVLPAVLLVVTLRILLL